MATYNVAITHKASRSFTNFEDRLIEMHRKFDRTVNPRQLKVITTYLLDNMGNSLITGTNENEKNYRYIRVIIDLIAGSASEGEKNELMRRTMECCQEYSKKNASQTEIEVRINEIEQRNLMRVQPGVQRADGGRGVGESSVR